MAQEPKALLLDFDGTLADSLDVMWQAYCAFMMHYRAVPSRDEFQKLNGPPLADVVAYLCDHHRIDASQADACACYHSEIEKRSIAVRPSAGAEHLLKSVRARGWKTAIVTSNDKNLVARWLEASGLAGFVDVVVGGEVTPGKPDPAPYLAALKHLSCAPALSFAVEDSAKGYASAVSAGVNALYYAPLDRQPAPQQAITIESLSAALPYLVGEKPAVRVRLATPGDQEFLYALRNDPVAVRNSKTARKLTIAELEQRFALDETLTKKITLIVEQDQHSIAMVRFDQLGQGYLVSIVLDASARGKGLGQTCLQYGIEAFLAMRGPVELHAEIADGNAASERIFKLCHFVRQGKSGVFGQFIRPASMRERVWSSSLEEHHFADAFKVEVLPARTLPDGLDARVDGVWQQAVRARPDLFDGPILTVVDIAQDKLVVAPARYRHLIAARNDEQLRQALQIRPLAVSGVLTCADGVVFGRRAQSVTQNPGEWELVPSGGVEPSVDGRAPDLRAQILTELHEETGVSADQVNVGDPAFAIDDRESGVVDVVVPIRTDLSIKQIVSKHKLAVSLEYDELVAASNFSEFCETYGPISGVSKFIVLKS